MKKHLLVIPKKFGSELVAKINKGLVEIQSGKCSSFEIDTTLDVRSIRNSLGVGQQSFAELLGISIKTLQDWEQGRRKPTKAARSLLLIAKNRPGVILEMFCAELLCLKDKESPQTL